MDQSGIFSHSWLKVCDSADFTRLTFSALPNMSPFSEAAGAADVSELTWKRQSDPVWRPDHQCLLAKLSQTSFLSSFYTLPLQLSWRSDKHWTKSTAEVSHLEFNNRISVGWVVKRWRFGCRKSGHTGWSQTEQLGAKIYSTCFTGEVWASQTEVTPVNLTSQLLS